MTAPPAGALEACLALLEKATLGEWRYVPWHIEEADAAVRAPDGSLICCTSSDNTSAAIAAAVNFLRTHGPALLAALRLREACEFRIRAWRADGPNLIEQQHVIYDYCADDLARVLEQTA